MSLREFCREHGFDAGNISKLERGKLPAPTTRAVLERYAETLGLEPGSDEWYRFYDLAAAERGRLPADLAEDDVVIGKLPVLFRTLRGNGLSEDDIRTLIDRIREA